MNIYFGSINRSICLLATLSFVVMLMCPSQAKALFWSGHNWTVTTGGMAGNVPADASNVTVDANGNLHLKITRHDSGWTGAELFSDEKFGFGTYQWQIKGDIASLDKNVVVGLFPYGPVGGVGEDGTNEIDIEFARWGIASWPNGNFTVYPDSGNTIGEKTFEFSLSSDLSTSTFVWSATQVDFMLQDGFKEIGDKSNTLKNWTYAPTAPDVNIPQQAIPVGINLWICSGSGPSDEQSVEIVIHSFKMATSAPVPKPTAIVLPPMLQLLIHSQ